ncbi:MAG: hypothetical protein PQJ46_01230 [Spirochaetales bacterium]|nr:hypothetical protein [Spirochaetales bacterium]
MSTSFEIVYSAEEATHWTPLRIAPDDDVRTLQYYDLYKEEVDGKETYYILTDHGKKRYYEDLKKKGDFIVF